MPPGYNPTMPRRLVALFLLGVFLGAGTTLPPADALLHDLSGAASEQHRGHVEPAGGCGSHADSCTLGRTASGAGAVVAHATVLRNVAESQAPPESLPDLPLTADPGTLHQSRAPPAPSV
jgi:hypothetical protein